MRKNIGNGYSLTGLRVYKAKWKNNKVVNILVSWSQKRCKKCGRFLQKIHSVTLCDKCIKQNKDQTRRLYMRKYRKVVGIWKK